MKKDINTIKIVKLIVKYKPGSTPDMNQLNPALEEITQFNHLMESTRTGGIKFNFRTGTKYIKQEDINNYSTHQIGDVMFLVFDTSYDVKKCLIIIFETLLDRAKQTILNLNKSILLYENYLKEVLPKNDELHPLKGYVIVKSGDKMFNGKITETQRDFDQ